MLSHIHEVLTQFMATVQLEMWNQGTSDSFYPPEARHQKRFITQSASGGIEFPIITATLITLTMFS